jgi:DNA-binding transcriptional LysR family regulator
VQVAACEQSGFKPHVTFQTNDYNVAQGLVAAGVAISLVPELALSNVREDIVIRPLSGRDIPVRKVVAATRGGYRSPAMTAMLGILERVAGQYVGRRGWRGDLRSAS